MENDLPKRKHPRLDHYDYSTPGAYFITICTQNRRCLLSHMIGRGVAERSGSSFHLVGRGVAERSESSFPPVGRGLAPAATALSTEPVGRGLAPAAEPPAAEPPAADAPAGFVYTAYGHIAREQLLLLEQRYPHLKVDRYVIMPNHIHAIFVLDGSAGASPRPTVTDMVCAYKSLTTRACKKAQFIGKLFQTSFYEHVIRGQADYDEISEYIMNNPKQWELDTLFSEE